MIEAGGHQNIDRNLRFCQICLKRNVYIVDGEFHLSLCALPMTLSGNYTLNQDGKML